MPYCNATSGVSMETTVYYGNTSTHTASSSMLVNRGLILLEKLPQEQEAGVGDLVNWTVKVTNIGTGPLFNVTVVDTLQSGLVLNSTTAPSWPVWHYDRIDVGETKIVYVVAEVVKCEDIFNTVNASWGCHGVCQKTFAQGSVVLLARPPEVSYTVEPSPLQIPYCDKAKVWVNITNSGEGVAKNVRFIMGGIPAGYEIANVTNATFYESNSTLYVGYMDKNSSKNISFQFGPENGLECSAPYSGTLVIDPKYEDQCDSPWAAPPVGFISFVREGGPSIEVSKTGPDTIYVGDSATFSITVTYNRGNCSLENITTNITDTFPQGFIVLDANGSVVHGNNLTWYNVTLHDGIPWAKSVTFMNNASCGMILTNSVSTDAVLDCCGCVFSGGASFSFASVCPQNYTAPKEIAWNKTASPPYTENSHNITYRNNIAFYFDANWSDIWFRERADNGQTFWPQGAMTGNATFIINGSIAVFHNITLGNWFNLSFLNNYSKPVNGTTLSIIYSMHQWNTGTFVDWADLNVTGHPNPDSYDGMYHSGTWITVDRAVYSISVDIPSVINDAELYNTSITISNNSNWDCHDMVVMLNSSNYAYIVNTTFIYGIQYYNETLAKYMNVSSFEPEKIGDYYVWNFSKHGYHRIHVGGNIYVHIVKKCGTPGGISGILYYRDNCGFLYQDNAYDAPSLLTKGDLIFFKTPEETFAYSRQLYWKIYVINKGNGTAFNVVARDLLPANLSYVYSTINGVADPANTTINGSTITWNLGNMTPNEMDVIYIAANLTGCNYVNNFAEVQWGCINGQICQEINDTSKVKLLSDRILVVSHNIDLIDTCGDESVGTIVLKNGQVDVYGVNVTEYLPENLTYVANSWNVTGAVPTSITTWGNNISWYFDVIARGATVTITFNVSIALPCSEFAQPATAKVNYTLPCTAFGTEDMKEFAIRKANPHLSISKMPEYIVTKPGDVANWTIVVTSDGNYEAKNITLQDILPPNTQYVSSSPTAASGNGTASNPLTWNLPNMSIGSSMAINISAKVLSCTASDTTNNATVAWGCCPFTRESNNAMAYLRTSPDVSLNQTHGDIIPCGGNFTIIIHNNGSVANVSSLWFELPAGYVYKSGSAKITSSNSSRNFADQEPYDSSLINGSIMWNDSNIDYIYSNETITIYFEVVDDGINCSDDVASYANTTFRYTNFCGYSFESNASNYVDPLHPLLYVTITPPNQILYGVGETATWQVDVSNNGDTTARNVTIVFIIGDAFGNSSIVVRYDNGSNDDNAIIKNNIITWLNQSISVGGNTWERTIQANVTAAGSTSSTVYVNGTCSSGCIYGNSTARTFVARHNISKSPDMTRTIGEYANFSINASLWGVGEMYRNVSVQDTLPDGVIYVNSTIDGVWTPANTSINGQIIKWYLGNITGAKYYLINVTAIVEDVLSNQNGTTLINTVNLSHEDEHGNIYSSQDDASILILEPDLRITKVANASIVESGDLVNYTITVQHTSASAWTAYDIWINDTIPDGMTYVSNSSSPHADKIVQNGQHIAWYYFSLSEGNVITINYTVRINSSIVANQLMQNEADVTWTGTSGSNENERFGNNTALDDYNRQDSISIYANGTAIIIKAVNKDNATVGEYVDYTISVDLPGDTFHDVWVNDTLPAGLVYGGLISLTANNDDFMEIVNGENISWYLGDVNNSYDSDITIFFRTVVNNTMANQEGAYMGGNIAELSAIDFNNNSVEVSNTSEAVLVKEPFLAIEKFNNASGAVEGGEIINYTLLVYHTAASTSDAYDIWINDTVPEKMQLLNAVFSLSPTVDNSAGRNLSFYYEKIPISNGQMNPVVIEYSVMILNNVTINETLDNFAAVQWTSVNATFGNESYERKGEHTALNDYNDQNSSSVRVKNASIVLSKTVWNGSSWVDYYHEDIGDEVTFNITITNTGEASLINITVNDNLPPILSNISWGANNAWLYAGPLNPGESIYIEFNATVVDSGAGINSANVTAYPYNITGKLFDEDTATVEGEDASIALIKNVWNGSAWVGYYDGDVGYEVTFNITITNTGTNPIADVNITDVLPSGLTNSTWGISNTWNIPLLGIGESYTIIFNSTVTSAGIQTNYANVTGYCENTSKPVYDEDTATVVVDAPNVTDPKVAVDINGPPLEPCDIICYTMWVNNTGDMDSGDNPGNEFEDMIPGNTTYLSNSIKINDVANNDDISDGIGYDAANDMVIWNGVIPAHTSIKISFCVTVDMNASCRYITNQGVVHYDSDGDGTNDADEPTDNPSTEPYNDPTNLTLDYSPPWSWLTVTLDPHHYVKGASTFTIHADDDIGPWKIYYKIDHVLHEGNWNEEVQFQLSGYGQGWHSIEYWAKDASENEETPHHVEYYYLDNLGPETHIDFDGSHEWNKTHWQISSSTAIILNAEDDGCGVKSIKYKIDNGNWNEYSEPFFVEDGRHTIYYYATDLLNNFGKLTSSVVEIGEVGPRTTCRMEPEEPDGKDGWYISDVTVYLISHSDTSEIDKIYYSLDGGSWKEYSSPVKISIDGTHTFSYYSVDKNGNAESIKSKVIKIDKTAPLLTIKKPKDGYLYIFGREIIPLKNTIIIGKITVCADASDSTTGIEKVEFYLDGVLKSTVMEEPYGWLCEEQALFMHNIRVIAYDNAGNVVSEEIKVQIYTVVFRNSYTH